jgi:hypothetical protein
MSTKKKFYAINSAGRQVLPVNNVMDAYEYVMTHSYWVDCPPTRIVETLETVFHFPEDFE